MKRFAFLDQPRGFGQIRLFSLGLTATGRGPILVGVLLKLDTTVRDRLGAALAGGPPLRLAVLFGSRATGEAGDGSDFDVGIVPVDPGLTLHAELALAASLSAAVSAEVDLVRLDEDAPLLGAEVARTGICLFEITPGTFASYRASAMSRWIDFEAVIAPHRARFLRRLAGSP
jgi:predicted nucleotidyltransferase